MVSSFEELKKKTKGLRQRLESPTKSRALTIDCAYIGGQSILDIIQGHVSDKDIDPEVIQAYHLQYPALSVHHAFTDEVRSMAGDPERLRGLISGVKGKLFETEYRDYLNHGHLPSGWHAELSHSATQPAVDLWIKDSQGHVHEELQAKATEHLQSVYTHLERYPGTDVIVPQEMLASVDKAGLVDHVTAVPITEYGLEQSVNGAATHAEAGLGFHAPWLGLSLLGAEALWLAYRGKPIPKSEMLQRAAKIGVSSLAGQGVFLLTSMSGLAIPAAILTRVILDKGTRAMDLGQFAKEKANWAKRLRENLSQ
jgi:hypothetical protein